MRKNTVTGILTGADVASVTWFAGALEFWLASERHVLQTNDVILFTASWDILMHPG